jgi:hypothetical protein
MADVTVEINGNEVQTDETGAFSFDREFVTGPYVVRIKRDGETIHRSSIDVASGESLQISVETGNGSGNQIVSNAQLGLVFGEVGVQSGMAAASTVEYLVGWLGGSVVPVADAFADTRDCVLAPNKGIASNFIDCGGAAVSVAGSAGTVVGAISSPTGVGAVVGVGSFSLDTAEDVVTVTKHLVTWTAKNPKKADEAVSAVISLSAGYARKVGVKVSDITDRIIKQLKKRSKKLADRARVLSLKNHLGRELAYKVVRRSGDEIDAKWYDPKKVSGWLREIESTKDYGRIIDDLKKYVKNGDWRNFQGTIFESKVAGEFKSVRNAEVDRIGKPIKNGQGDIDVITAKGDMIEVKSTPPSKGDIGTKLATYRRVRAEEGYTGEIKFVFGKKPNGEKIEYLKSEGVECLISTADGDLVQCADVSSQRPLSDRSVSTTDEQNPSVVARSRQRTPSTA